MPFSRQFSPSKVVLRSNHLDSLHCCFSSLAISGDSSCERRRLFSNRFKLEPSLGVIQITLLEHCWVHLTACMQVRFSISPGIIGQILQENNGE